MSGGVDSSVAAAILVEEGYEVIGVTMRIWPCDAPMMQASARTCCSLSAIQDAERVAARLGIRHYVLNFKDIFQQTVIDNFVQEYRRGRTPNPCIRCNRFVKFDALLTKARTYGAEYVATGHYSRIVHDDRWLLKRGVDGSKDQSYALYCMTQEQLAHALMPLGNLIKDETRHLAAKLGLAVATKPESQEICFVENRDYPSFIKRHAPEVAVPGPILDTAGGEIGLHEGIAFYTIGQRKRIGIAAREPLYVVDIDPERNAIIVGRDDDLYSSQLTAEDMVYICERPDKPIAVTAKVRYNMKDAPALLSPLAGNQAHVRFDGPQRAITPGQAVVCYQGEDVLGGGTIRMVDGRWSNGHMVG